MFKRALPMETPERILIVYLKTGGGHITLAQIIAQKILARGDGAEAVLRNGFAPGQFFCRSLFETGYHLTSIAARGAYSLYYDINLIPWVLRITTALVNLRTRYHLRRIVRREGITRIVCLHFALGPGCRFAADRAGRKVPVFVVVTDPFTAHPSWFLAPDAHYIVFSRELKTHMREKFGIEDARIFPFVLKDEYTRPQETESAGGKKGVFSVLVT
ncbi:MAG: hypothetical protein LBR23_02255, partial [Spirochaetaceae bacterium]|nr:hypothetical protein [Spirochaetaceae bacterium]